MKQSITTSDFQRLTAILRDGRTHIDALRRLRSDAANVLGITDADLEHRPQLHEWLENLVAGDRGIADYLRERHIEVEANR